MNHQIRNLNIKSENAYDVGLFARTDYPGELRDISLINARVIGGLSTGALVGSSEGVIIRSFASGIVEGINNVGGLIGFEFQGKIIGSGTDVKVRATDGGLQVGGLVGWARFSDTVECFSKGTVTGDVAGGLVGESSGAIERSYSSAAVHGKRKAFLGGLLGLNELDGEVHDSYSTGPVTGAGGALVGGLVGWSYRFKGQADAALAATSYSTGMVLSGNHKRVGGFAGTIDEASKNYWNITTSGTSIGAAKGCGSQSCKANVVALTDDQLKAALPPGFDPSIWGQAPNINNGYPYLLANPPK